MSKCCRNSTEITLNLVFKFYVFQLPMTASFVHHSWSATGELTPQEVISGKTYQDPAKTISRSRAQKLSKSELPRSTELPTTKILPEFVNSPPKLSRFKNPRELCGNYPKSRSRGNTKKLCEKSIKIRQEELLKFLGSYCINILRELLSTQNQDPAGTTKIPREL